MENFLDNLNLQYDDKKTKGMIEAILFAAGDPISLREVSEIIGADEKYVKNVVKQMNKDYEDETRGIFVIEFNNKLQLSTRPEFGQLIKKLVKPEGRQNLSQAALETLAIIAYKQPITRAQIDEIRGVRSDRAVATLLERGLIKESGRLEAAGRPVLFSTTEDFLKYFGFKNIKELPELIEFNLNFVEE